MKRRFGWILIIMAFSAVMAVNVRAELELDGEYMTLKDDGGRIIARTAHQISIGDEYLNSNNELYRVEQVEGDTALVKLVRKERLTAESGTGFRGLLNDLFNLRAEVKSKGPIGIYHTHSDESYVPTDGKSSRKGSGGIIKVGETLAKALEKKGIPVVHDKSIHDPHDALAYDRSRRTAAQILKKGPSCILDVHRDAVPREEYSKIINGQGVTKVQLVVGRENPNFRANNDFAKQVKAKVDQKYPGLIKGIFYGTGKYNQDLGPRTLLLEFGTHTNSRESAERGAAIFAEAAADVLYGAAGAGFVNRGSWRSLFWVIAAVVGGIALFMLLNREGFKNIGKEFTGAVGEERPEEEEKSSGNNPGESS
ncbi:MAG: stage II sporulation protein P [Firmicutes bacterium]|nr:stage II sporulation protein P [Bacillota bacterium]